MENERSDAMTIYFERADEAEATRMELVGMGVPENEIELDIPDERIADKAKRLFGVIHGNTEGAVMHVHGMDLLRRGKIDQALRNHHHVRIAESAPEEPRR